MKEKKELSLGRFLFYVCLGLAFIGFIGSKFSSEDSSSVSGGNHNRTSTREVSTESATDKITRLADVESWYYDRPGTVDKKLKKALGRNASKYKEIVSSAAYMVAKKTGRKVEMVTSNDGKRFTVTTDDNGIYNLDYSDLKDSKGNFYTASDAAELPDIKTQYEKWIAKSCPKDSDITMVKSLLAKNSNYPATLDVDWFTSEQDLDVYSDGTRELSVNFSNKNGFGVEVRYTATISISPKCTYRIAKLEKY